MDPYNDCHNIRIYVQDSFIFYLKILSSVQVRNNPLKATSCNKLMMLQICHKHLLNAGV